MMMIIMEKEFKQYGRKMPYEVPEGFFEDMQAQLLEAADRNLGTGSRVKTIGTEPAPKRRAWHWGLAGGIAAALVTVLLLWDGPDPKRKATKMEYLYSYNNEMSDYEMIEIAEMIGNDIFLSLDME